MSPVTSPTQTASFPALSFDQVPGFSRTWLSVLNRDKAANQLFARLPMDLEACKASLQETLAQERDYKKLAEILHDEGRRYGVPAEALARLKLLSEGKAAVVVSGQQVGYLGGPFYTFLKAYHTTRLARALEASLKFPVLPVFWLEGEDHDLKEIQSSSYPLPDGTLASVTLSMSPEIPNFEVGRYAVPDEVIEHIHAMAAAINPANAQAAEILESSYRGSTLSDAMGKVLAATLGGRGLLLVEGMNPDLKKMAIPLWRKVIQRGPALAEIFEERASNLKKDGWPASMSPTRDAFMFYVTDESHVRRVVTYDGQIRNSDGSAVRVSMNELQEQIESGKLNISPKAGLRPLYQDFVLPSIAYVGGPGELDYHAQLTPFYSELGVSPPPLFPRMSVTILDNKSVRAIEKTGLKLSELMSQPEHILTKEILRHADAGQSDKWFAVARFGIEKTFNQLQEELKQVDLTLAGAALNAAGRSLHPLEQLEQKTQKALKQRHALALSRLEKAISAVRPNGKPAERAIGTAYYLLKFGPIELLEMLDAIPGDGLKHHIIAAE